MLFEGIIVVYSEIITNKPLYFAEKIIVVTAL
jgi:hypothetical protein